MPIRRQVLHSIEFVKLKGLNNLKITFEPNSITGIFGVNGSGKSSIIHALLAIYKPGDQHSGRRNFKFSQFFTPTTHTTWRGSNFKIIHSYHDGTPTANLTRIYSKVGDRWNPRYTARPEREVYFIGIDSCVPAIEIEKRDSIINFPTALRGDALSVTIRERASYILNRAYEEYNEHVTAKKTYIGLKYNNISYSSLSMGAGEQRLFKILETVYRAVPYSLIVIDEIDLTLHTDALNRLINVLKARADDKHLQIVFTSHREDLAKRTDVNIRHIFQTPTQTLCFNSTNPDCISRLTGVQAKPIEIFVEDDMAEAITRKVAEELNIIKYCSIKRLGAATNAFPLAMGMQLKGENLTDISIFLDGDVFITFPEKQGQMNSVYSGNEPDAVQRRTEALSIIRQFNLPAGSPPEQFINNAIRQINDGSEIVAAALNVNGVLDKHQYVSMMMTELGYPKQIGLSKIVDKLSATPEWAPYTLPLRDWLSGRIIALQLLP